MTQSKTKWEVFSSEYASKEFTLIDTEKIDDHIRVYGPDREQQAARIVKAVNSHDALVEALKQLIPDALEAASSIKQYAPKAIAGDAMELERKVEASRVALRDAGEEV